MIQIRPTTFETNSSSTHSLIMCADDDYKDWINGRAYLCISWYTPEGVTYSCEEDEFYPAEEVDRMFREEMSSYEREEFFATFEEYFDDEYLETFDEEYKTKHGEIVHAFGKYGYDG